MDNWKIFTTKLRRIFKEYIVRIIKIFWCSFPQKVYAMFFIVVVAYYVNIWNNKLSLLFHILKLHPQMEFHTYNLFKGGII